MTAATVTYVVEFFIKAASIAYWGPICGSPKNTIGQRKVYRNNDGDRDDDSETDHIQISKYDDDNDNADDGVEAEV